MMIGLTPLEFFAVLFLKWGIPIVSGVLCAIYRKKVRVVVTILIAAAVFYGLCFSAIVKTKYKFSLTILDPNRRPLSGLTVSYFCWGGGGGHPNFTPILRGSGTVETDTEGRVVFRLNHRVCFALKFQDDARFEPGYFEMRNYIADHHLVMLSQSIVYLDPVPKTDRNGDWELAVYKACNFVVAVKPKSSSRGFVMP
jgi:hypothetical protein